MMGRLLAISLMVALCACGPEPSYYAVPATNAKSIVTRSSGKTTVIVSFLVFSSPPTQDIPTPVPRTDLDFRQFVDDEAVSDESILSEDQTTLPSELHLAYVLDTSYSMVASGNFDIMLDRAKTSLQQIQSLWLQHGGKFSFELFWFRDWVYHATNAWTPEQIGSIPAPVPGSFTRLYGGARAALESMLAQYNAGVAAGPRDRQVMVLFTDGRDNFSAEDNSSFDPPPAQECPPAPPQPSRNCVTSVGAPFEYLFSPPSTIGDVKNAITAHPTVKVHVLALGREDGDMSIDKAALAEIANYGRGQLLINDNSVDDLFAGLQNLFVDEIRVGSLLPNPPGHHDYRVDIYAHGDDVKRATCTLSFDTSTSPITVDELLCGM